MALEINEIDIRMNVQQHQSNQNSQPQAPTDATGCDSQDYESIVSDCTQQVLARLAAMEAR